MPRTMTATIPTLTIRKHLKHLGSQVLRLRTASCLTQEDFADRLRVNQSYVAKLERVGAASIYAKTNVDVKVPSTEFLLSLAYEFNISLDALLGTGPSGDVTVVTELDGLPEAMKEQVREMIRQMKRAARWQTLSDSVQQIGGAEAVAAASAKLDVALTPSSENVVAAPCRGSSASKQFQRELF